MKKTISIHIGEFYISNEPVIIHTLLGSCVAVCLFDPEHSIGGMNHILLPGASVSTNDTHATRYAVNAMEILISGVLGLGGHRDRLQAKVFGGAHVLSSISDSIRVGNTLSQFVIDCLKKERIKVIKRDFGGDCIRKLFFHTDSGDVYLKRRSLEEHSALAVKEMRQIKTALDRIEKTGKAFPAMPRDKNFNG